MANPSTSRPPSSPSSSQDLSPWQFPDPIAITAIHSPTDSPDQTLSPTSPIIDASTQLSERASTNLSTPPQSMLLSATGRSPYTSPDKTLASSRPRVPSSLQAMSNQNTTDLDPEGSADWEHVTNPNRPSLPSLRPCQPIIPSDELAPLALIPQDISIPSAKLTHNHTPKEFFTNLNPPSSDPQIAIIDPPDPKCQGWLDSLRGPTSAELFLAPNMASSHSLSEDDVESVTGYPPVSELGPGDSASQVAPNMPLPAQPPLQPNVDLQLATAETCRDSPSQDKESDPGLDASMDLSAAYISSALIGPDSPAVEDPSPQQEPHKDSLSLLPRPDEFETAPVSLPVSSDTNIKPMHPTESSRRSLSGRVITLTSLSLMCAVLAAYISNDQRLPWPDAPPEMPKPLSPIALKLLTTPPKSEPSFSSSLSEDAPTTSAFTIKISGFQDAEPTFSTSLPAKQQPHLDPLSLAPFLPTPESQTEHASQIHRMIDPCATHPQDHPTESPFRPFEQESTSILGVLWQISVLAWLAWLVYQKAYISLFCSRDESGSMSSSKSLSTGSAGTPVDTLLSSLKQTVNKAPLTLSANDLVTLLGQVATNRTLIGLLVDQLKQLIRSKRKPSVIEVRLLGWAAPEEGVEYEHRGEVKLTPEERMWVEAIARAAIRYPNMPLDVVKTEQVETKPELIRQRLEAQDAKVTPARGRRSTGSRTDALDFELTVLGTIPRAKREGGEDEVDEPVEQEAPCGKVRPARPRRSTSRAGETDSELTVVGGSGRARRGQVASEEQGPVSQELAKLPKSKPGGGRRSVLPDPDAITVVEPGETVKGSEEVTETSGGRRTSSKTPTTRRKGGVNEKVGGSIAGRPPVRQSPRTRVVRGES